MVDRELLKQNIVENINDNGRQKITGSKLQKQLLDMVDSMLDPEGRYPDMSVGFSDNLVGRGESTPAEFTFRATGGKSIKDGAARIKRIKGNSVVWNNMADTRHLSNEFSYQNDYMRLIQGHKYLFSRTMANAGIYCIPVIDGQEKYEYSMQLGVYSIIFTSAYDTTPSTTVIYNEKESGSVQLIDLTKMFGAGNEPSTIEEYNARKPIVADEYAYNEGEVIHCNTESIKSVGDNAWDEQWEKGYINSGTAILEGNAFSSINHIKVLPNETYYFTISALSGDSYFYIWLYDQNKNVLGHSTINKCGDGMLSVPSNCHYIRFYVEGMTTYNHDILFSLYHSGWKSQKDDQYQPYWQDTLPLPIIRKYFPDGMKSAGSAHDEIRFNKASGKWEKVQRVTSLDLGTLTWDSADSGHFYAHDELGDIGCGNLICAKYSTAIGAFSGMPADKAIGNNPESPYNKMIFVRDDAYTDAASFKAAMQGVMLYYELAEPVIREIDEPIGTDYRVADFGTEQAISSTPSAPFSADIIYQFNAVDMIREHQIEIENLKSMVATMQTYLTSLVFQEK